MNIGSTSMDAPAMAAMGALKSALNTQASAAAQLLSSGTQDSGQMVQAAAAELGKGQKLDLMV